MWLAHVARYPEVDRDARNFFALHRHESQATTQEGFLDHHQTRRSKVD
jgi:hypothetical protein